MGCAQPKAPARADAMGAKSATRFCGPDRGAGDAECLCSVALSDPAHARRTRARAHATDRGEARRHSARCEAENRIRCQSYGTVYTSDGSQCAHCGACRRRRAAMIDQCIHADEMPEQNMPSKIGDV